MSKQRQPHIDTQSPAPWDNEKGNGEEGAQTAKKTVNHLHPNQNRDELS